MNERDFPHLVELPPGGFRNRSLEFGDAGSRFMLCLR